MSKKNVGQYRVIGHSRGNPCPRCRKLAYCDDCAFCESCEFSAPTGYEQPRDPKEPLRTCAKCGGAYHHDRTCPMALRAAQN